MYDVAEVASVDASIVRSIFFCTKLVGGTDLSRFASKPTAADNVARKATKEIRSRSLMGFSTERKLKR